MKLCEAWAFFFATWTVLGFLGMFIYPKRHFRIDDGFDLLWAITCWPVLLIWTLCHWKGRSDYAL